MTDKDCGWLEEYGINAEGAKCYNCGSPRHPMLWFCGECIAAKEAAYAECRRLETNDYVSVMIKREEYLSKIRKEKNVDEEALTKELGEADRAFILPIKLKEPDE